MRIEITTVEVFERALLLPADERTKLVSQLLSSLENLEGAEQISARFRALDARVVDACVREEERFLQEQDEPFGARLA